MSDYDVIIIGAGPAGSVSAHYLASHQLRVLLVEKQTFPRYKPCGGGLPMHTLELLPFDLKPVLHFPAAGGSLSYKGEPRLRAALEDEFAWLSMRDTLDAFLLEKAQEAGAECINGVRVLDVIEENDRVCVHTSNGRLKSKFLIGADGVNSIVARSLNLLPDRQTGTALEAEIEVSEQALQAQGKYVLFDFGALPHGYGWIFPKRDHLSVGVFQARNGKASNLREDLERFIRCQPVLEQHEILHLQGHHIPLGGKHETLHTRRCLLVGDAANLADPWLGEGIYYAVQSGILAAEALIQAASNPSCSLASYSLSIKESILKDFRYAERISRMIYKFPGLATGLISRSRVMQNSVFRCIRGDLTFSQLWKELRIRLPAILLQAIFYRGDNQS